MRLIRFGGHLPKGEYDGHDDGAQGSTDTHDTSSLMYLNPSMLPSVDTQIQPLIDTANPAIN